MANANDVPALLIKNAYTTLPTNQSVVNTNTINGMSVTLQNDLISYDFIDGNNDDSVSDTDRHNVSGNNDTQGTGGDLIVVDGDPTQYFVQTIARHTAVVHFDDGSTQTIADGLRLFVLKTNEGNGANYGSVIVSPLDAVRAVMTKRVTDITIAGASGTREATSTNIPAQDDPFPADAFCFGKGTKLRTNTGNVAIEDLAIGDMILTADNGLQPIRWIGSSQFSAAELAEAPHLRPIRIRANALTTGLPKNDLIVSPQHRILVRSKIAQRMFGVDEVLVAAKQLLEIDGVEVAEDLQDVTYFHMLFDDHEIVFADGAETESMYTGSQALNAVGESAREEIFTIFPKLRDLKPDMVASAARYLVRGRQGRQLAKRHAENNLNIVN